MRRNISLVRVIVSSVNVVLSFVIIGLVIRFIFRLIGASSESDFVSFIYRSTDPLLAPFRGAFPPAIIDQGNILEFNTLIAIVLYLIIAWLIIELISIFGIYTRRIDRENQK